MKIRIHLLFFLVMVTLLFPILGVAADGDKVTLKLTAFKQVMTMVDGKEQVSLVPAEEVVLGDIIRYDIDFANTSNEEVFNFAIVDPIPEGVLFVNSTGLDNTTTLFSIDKGFSYHEPPIYYEKIEKDGTRTKAEAGPDKYTHIKWLFNGAIKPGQEGTVSFTSRVQ